MAVLSATNPLPIVPIIGSETDIVTIAPGTPLDNLSVYFQGGVGGGGGAIGLALYAVVGGFRTRVAQAQVQGSAIPSIIEFQTIGAGSSESEQVDAGGTSYIITAIDLSTALPTPTSGPRGGITVTLAGVDQFDTAPDANFGAVIGPLAPGATGTLPVLAGYAQLMDVAIDQTNLPGALVSIAADCGQGSVQAVVISRLLSGRDQTIASVFRGIILPVATRYFVSVTNASTVVFGVTLTAVTYSVSITAGGVVVLGGDVIGPLNANTVIKWDNVPLLLGAAPGFGAPVDTAIPIFDAGLGVWRTFPLSGAATMSNTGVVTLTAGAVVTLLGNTNGPSNANTAQDFTIESTNADVPAASFVGPQGETSGSWYVGLAGLTANRTVTVPDMPSGSKVTIKDENGSLGNDFTITVVSASGKTIDGMASYVMSLAQNGSKGSITIEMNGRAPTEWQVV